MPFSKPLSYSSPYFWSTQVGRCAHTTCNELVKETVLKPSVEGRREAMAGE
jgi:hypothetical protein